MAGNLHPRDEPRATKSYAERKLWQRLKLQLPDGWRAWHSLKLRVGSRWQGESDFVIAAPGRGLLVIEVKGGQLELSGGHWYQNGEKLKESPKSQADGFVRKLCLALKDRGATPPPYGTACAFPDCDFSDGPTCGDLEGLVIGQRQLPYLAEALPALVARAVPPYRVPKDGKWISVLHDLWGDTWVPEVKLADLASDAEARRIQLDEEQLQVLDIAGEAKRALVRGGAGSGKTVVARELCVRRAAAGQRVQYFCFTEALGHAVARHLRNAAAGDRGNARGTDRIWAAPIRRYAAELLAKAGSPIKRDDPEFWAGASFEAAVAGLSHVAERPDLIVIDEAQDLDESDWTLVEELSQGRDLWIFSDERQTFWTERQIPDSLTETITPLSLRTQHRNPVPIWNFAAGYGEAARAPAPMTHLLDGAPVRIIVAPSSKLEAKLAHELTELRRAGARPSDIAVLTLAGQKLSDIWGKQKLGPHPVASADADGAHQATICDTFLRFKGLERPYVILTELLPGHSSRYESRMHIAATRATVALTIACTPEALDRDPRLRALAHDNLV